MRSDCQHPDCLTDGLKNGHRYCEGECQKWADERLNKGLKASKTQKEAVAYLNKFARKWNKGD